MTQTSTEVQLKYSSANRNSNILSNLGTAKAMSMYLGKKSENVF